ncbi:MAG: hypothetical protein IKK84_00125 [Clostridia bacterium]|nr:hypothetical protein [Clostridia bacterium]
MVDTKGFDKVLPNIIAKLPEGNELRNALLTVLAEEDEVKAQGYYDKLAECWAVQGNLDNLDPHYLLEGVACKDGKCEL